jgi:hypothetical protein
MSSFLRTTVSAAVRIAHSHCMVGSATRLLMHLFTMLSRQTSSPMYVHPIAATAIFRAAVEFHADDQRRRLSD